MQQQLAAPITRTQRSERPRRLLVAISVLQLMSDFGPEIFEGRSVHRNVRLTGSGLSAEVTALQQLLAPGQPTREQLVVSRATLGRVSGGDWPHYRRWVGHVQTAWLSAPDQSSTASRVVDHPRLDQVSVGDRRLVGAALDHGCDAVLTLDRKLPASTALIRHVTGVQLLRPTGYAELLRPRAALRLAAAPQE